MKTLTQSELDGFIFPSFTTTVKGGFPTFFGTFAASSFFLVNPYGREMEEVEEKGEGEKLEGEVGAEVKVRKRCSIT